MISIRRIRVLFFKENPAFLLDIALIFPFSGIFHKFHIVKNAILEHTHVKRPCRLYFHKRKSTVPAVCRTQCSFYDEKIIG